MRLSPSTRRAYGSRVGGYLRWLAGPDLGGSDLGGGDPLSDPAARTRAVEEFRSWLRRERAARPTTVNATLTALDHFYAHLLGIGETGAARVEPDSPSPNALRPDELGAFLRAVAMRRSARDRAIAQVLVDTGLLVSELIALDLPQLQLAAPRPRLLVPAARDGTRRQVPLPPIPRSTLREWLRDRRNWRGCERSPAVFINRAGGRLSSRWITELVTTIGQAAELDRSITPALLRRTFATQRLADGADPHDLAVLMGHKRTHTTTAYRQDS